MKKIIILAIIAVLVSIAIFQQTNKEVRQITVSSVLYGEQVIEVDFLTSSGDVVRVNGNEGHEYNSDAIIQHVGHIATVK